MTFLLRYMVVLISMRDFPRLFSVLLSRDCIHAYIHTYTYTRIHTQMSPMIIYCFKRCVTRLFSPYTIRTHTHTYIHTHRPAHVYLNARHPGTFLCPSVSRLYTCIHTHVYMHTHAHTYTYIYTGLRMSIPMRNFPGLFSILSSQPFD